MSNGYSYVMPESGFKPVSPGLHQAVIFQFAHLGYQDGGKFRPTTKIALNFKTAEGTTIVKKLTLSSHTNGALKEFLEGLLGTSLTEQQIKTFDFGSLIGKGATLQVVHKTGGNGKTSAQIQNVLPAVGDAYASIVPDDFAFYVPGMAPEVAEAEFVKLPKFLQTQLTEAQYRAQLAAWDKANPKQAAAA